MRVLSIAAIVLSGPAMAQELADWSGPFGGLSLGGGDAGVASAFAGYQRDFGGVVLGGEIEGSQGGELDTTRLKLRIGAPFGNTLVYGLAGVGYADGTLDGISGEGAGYTVGLGAERQIAPGLRLGAEVTRDEYEFDGIGTAEDTSVRARLTLNF